MRISGSPLKPVSETFETSCPAFRLILQSFHGSEPLSMVIVGIHNLKPQRAGISRAFVLPHKIFTFWIDIRVAIVYHRPDPVVRQGFHYRRRARGTTGVEKYSILTARDFYLQFSFHRLACRKESPNKYCGTAAKIKKLFRNFKYKIQEVFPKRMFLKFRKGQQNCPAEKFSGNLYRKDL